MTSIPGFTTVCNEKIDLKEIGCGGKGVGWINLAKNRK
jgi:hypothetical protein